MMKSYVVCVLLHSSLVWSVVRGSFEYFWVVFRSWEEKGAVDTKENKRGNEGKRMRVK